MKRYGLVLTEFEEMMCPGAIHCYVSGWCYDDPGDGSGSVKKYFDEIVRILTEHEAIKLNKKDGSKFGFGVLRSGDETSRFNSRQDALIAGAKFLRGIYGEAIEVEIGEHYCLENPIYEPNKGERT